MSSKNGDNNHSTDVTDSIGNKGKSAFNTGKFLAKNGKSIFRFGKFIVSFLTKVIMSLFKWLLAIVGPYVLVALVVIVLVLLVLQSVSSFDLFQRGNERTAAEVIFDETVKTTFQENIGGNASTTLNDYFSNMQSGDPYPGITAGWIEQLAGAIKPSYAVPTIHYYFDTMDSIFRPWHAKYKRDDASDKAALIEKYKEIQNKELKYYFKKSKAYQPEILEKAVPIEEYIKTTSTSVCTVVDEEGNTSTTTSGPTVNKKVLPKRSVADKVSMGYSDVTLEYEESAVTSTSTHSSGDCTTTVVTETVLYLLVESMPTVMMDSAKLVRILMKDAEKGEHTKLVKAQDLETAFEIGKAADPAFPEPDIEYTKFTKCMNEDKKGLDACITLYVKQLASATWGGVVGYNGVNNRGWYPAEYEEIYKEIAKKTGVDWSAIAAIHGIETSFSRNPVATDRNLKSSAGARGHFQVVPLTWVGWSIRNSGLVTSTSVGDITSNIDVIYSLSNIKKYGGKGMDGDGDGKADPWNLRDAMMFAATYIKSLGYVSGNEAAIKKAFASYNGGPANYMYPAAQRYASEAYAMHLAFQSGMSNGVAFGDSATPIPVTAGDVTWPTVGRFTSKYGYRVLPGIYGTNKPQMHWGIDIANSTGTPVVSAMAGTIYKIEQKNYKTNWGLYVVVKHNLNGQTYYTNYAHLNGYASGLHINQPVQKGEIIGYMGFTGRGSGPHLHFEVYKGQFSYGKTNMNPLSLLPAMSELKGN